MKISDREAHVCMGTDEVKPGDQVALYKSVCTPLKGPDQDAATSGCKKVKVGNGKVESILNEHYSVVKVDSGVLFEEGTIVEKE